MTKGPTRMGSKTGAPATNGSGARRLASWIDHFVSYNDNLESPVLFRKWSAITAIAAICEAKVWLMTSSPVYPNLYTFLIGHPGTGKTRTINKVKEYLSEIPDFHFAPHDMKGASLIDALAAAKRHVVQLPDPPLEYNSLMIAVDEVGTFMHKYDNEVTSLLSAFYDPTPFRQKRRGGDLDIKIARPQVNILGGSTPSNLIELMPEGAWTQGFTSRIIMVFSDEKIIGDDFASQSKPLSQELLHDLRIISTLVGQYKVTPAYRDAVNNWRQLGEPPVPNHPKLLHYNTRRRMHLYKLSLISAIDRSNSPVIDVEDFNRAMGWLLEAEALMPDIFKAGAIGSDGKVQDELYHFILTKQGEDPNRGVPERLLVNYARERLPAHSVMRSIELMQLSGMIKKVAYNKTTGQYSYRVLPKLNLDRLDD